MKKLFKRLNLSSKVILGLGFIAFAAFMYGMGGLAPDAALASLIPFGLIGAVSEFPAKSPVCKHNIVRNLTLNQSGTTIISSQLPLGEGWYSLLLSFKVVLTIGTGTTAKAEGLLRMIRDILLKTDRDNIIVKAPGRMLYYRAEKLMGAAPYSDTWAASSATYYVDVPIHFANRRLRRPEDTILNTGRYRNAELHITLGSLTDMLGTPGTATMVVTMDCTVEKTYNAVDETNAPIMLPYIYGLPAVDPNTLQYIDVEKNPTLALLDVQLFSSNTDVIAGIAGSGTAANAVISDVTMYDNIKSVIRSVPFLQLQRDNLTKFDLNAVRSGQAIMDFIEDGSVLSGLPTGDKAVLQAQWVNDTPSGGQVTALIDGVRAFQS